MKAVRVNKYGGPEVLNLEQIPDPRPGPGEVLVEIRIAGLNYIDTYQRQGLYKVALPFTLGLEGAGIVTDVGPEVTGLQPQQRVAFAMSLGAYAQYAVVPAWKLVPLPDQIDFEIGTAAMVQGLTAHYLTRSTFAIKAGDTAVVHAAAGGVGLLLTQMVKHRGGRVIATVSTDEKAALAREAGADDVVIYARDDFEAAVKQITGGRGADVVYESVGQTTFEKSLNCLRPRGYLVLFGQASGPVAPMDPQILNTKGSLFLTRPSLGHYIRDREELEERSGELFSLITAGNLNIRIGARYPLEKAADAHRDLEGRHTTGKVVFTV